MRMETAPPIQAWEQTTRNNQIICHSLVLNFPSLQALGANGQDFAQAPVQDQARGMTRGFTAIKIIILAPWEEPNSSKNMQF